MKTENAGRKTTRKRERDILCEERTIDGDSKGREKEEERRRRRKIKWKDQQREEGQARD